MDDNKNTIEIIVLKNALHGGAWKVAYADFVTAMMAFFLLMWLLNVATDEQKLGLSNYFDPQNFVASDSVSGSGGVMGGLSMSPKGAMKTDTHSIQRIEAPLKNSGHDAAVSNTRTRDKTQKTEQKFKAAKASKREISLEQAKKKLQEIEKKKFDEAKEKIRMAIEKDPKLKALSKNILIDQTPEGLRIQIVDEDGKSMFASGSARMYQKTRSILQKISAVIETTTINEMSIRGHTDSVPYGSDAAYTNWELSSDRANASRRVMLDSGIPSGRLNNVVGKADTEHLMPDDPTNARNRRISVILLKEELTNPDYGKKVEEEAKVIENEMSDAEYEAALEAEYGDATDTENDGNTVYDDSNGINSVPAQIPTGAFKPTPGQVHFP